MVNNFLVFLIIIDIIIIIVVIIVIIILIWIGPLFLVLEGLIYNSEVIK